MTLKRNQNPPLESVEVNGDGATAAPEESGPSEQIPQPETAESEVSELAAVKAEAEEWRDRFLRKAAELENLRKRMERERTDSISLAKASVLAELLPIMDACERAMSSFSDADEQQESLDRYREGVELLYRQLGSTMNRLGVTPIEAEGEPFDPYLHEAVSREETTKVEENTVTAVLRRGYTYNDRLLRPAQVVVAVRPRNGIER